MNKTININLAGIIFHVDEEAYQVLMDYLNKLKSKLMKHEGSEEILMDVESRIAELFNERFTSSRQVVDMSDVQAVIDIMGQPEDYDTEEDEDQNSGSTSYSQSDSERTFAGPKRLFRDPDDNILGGVCSGIAAYFNTDPIWIRLLFVAMVLLGSTGFWLYIILWIVIPEAKTTAQKLQMRGEKINLSNIERSVKEELRGVGKAVNNLGKDQRLRKSGNKIATAIEDFFSAVLTVLTSILKIAFKIIGVALLLGGVVLIVVLLSALIGYGGTFNGDALEFGTLYDYAMAFFPTGYNETYLWTAVALTAVGPVFGIVALGSRILFNYKVHNKPVVALASLSSVAGFVMFLILGFAVSSEFRTDDMSRESFSLTDISKDEAIIVKASHSEYYKPYDSNWYVEEGELIISDVEFDVKKTNEAEPYIEITKSSRGKTRAQASHLVEEIRYSVVQNENEIVLDEFLTTAISNKFRDQDVRVVLYLPEGFSVYLDNSSRDVIYDIKNVTDTYDAYMVNHVWYMSTEGLACADCESSSTKRSTNETEEFEEEWLEEARRMEEELRKAPKAPTTRPEVERNALPQSSNI